MLVNKNNYSQMVKKASKNSPKLRDTLFAFIIGGIICVIGQLLSELYRYLGLGNQQVIMLVPVTLIFLAILLTAFKVFDKVAKLAGSGTLVPITGFANAVASTAIEFKAEGNVLGIGVKIFTVAGPVILFGTVASVIYGVIYWITTLF